jgi:transcription elongation factor Elf1
MEFIKDLGMKLPTANSKRKRRFWLCMCPNCKTEVSVMADSVKSGTATQCKNCSNKAKVTHGDTKTRLYNIWRGILERCNNTNAKIYQHYGAKGITIWRGILERCNNTNAKIYQHYGAKGITICDEWLSYEVFKKWSLSSNYTDTLSIDRKDTTGGYTPSNCRWVTPLVQSQNQGLYKTNTSGYKGVSFKKGKYEASISDNNKRIHLGRFTTAEDAAKAYNAYIVANSTHHQLNIIQELSCTN